MMKTDIVLQGYKCPECGFELPEGDFCPTCRVRRQMPLTAKGKKIMKSMKKQYGKKKAEEVFYASKNKGVISGVDRTKKKKSKKSNKRSKKGQ